MLTSAVLRVLPQLITPLAASSLPLYTLNQSFPVISSTDVLTITYYDDYSWTGWYGSYNSKDNTWGK